MERVKQYSQRLGAAELYPLFACMLTARSWDSVKRGIGQAPVSATEVGDPLPGARLGAWGSLPARCLRFMLVGCGGRAGLEPHRMRSREESRNWHWGEEGRGRVAFCVPWDLISLEER